MKVYYRVRRKFSKSGKTVVGLWFLCHIWSNTYSWFARWLNSLQEEDCSLLQYSWPNDPGFRGGHLYLPKGDSDPFNEQIRVSPSRVARVSSVFRLILRAFFSDLVTPWIHGLMIPRAKSDTAFSNSLGMNKSKWQLFPAFEKLTIARSFEFAAMAQKSTKHIQYILTEAKPRKIWRNYTQKSSALTYDLLKGCGSDL